MTDVIRPAASSAEDTNRPVLIDQASLRAAMRRLGIWQPVTVRWVSREDNPTAVSAVYYDDDRHTIELRHGIGIDETARLLRRELAQCAQSEAFGNEWAIASALDPEGWDADLARLARSIEDIALVRDPSAPRMTPARRPRIEPADPCEIQAPTEWVAIRADALAVIDSASATIAEIIQQFDADEAEQLCELVRSRVAHANREILSAERVVAA